MSTAVTDVDLDTIPVETPENVDFSVAPAGIGVRSFAYLIDLMIRATPFLVILILLALSGNLLWIREIGAIVAATMLLLVFAVQWLYFVLFEFFWNGRTPGKRVMRIRVVMDGGYPVTFLAAAVRNLLRFADSLPFAYTAGVVTVFASRRSKRLGDFAAGTIVVRDEPFDVRYLNVIERASAPAAVPAAAGVSLSPQEIDLITRFLERQCAFDAQTQAAVGGKIARSIHAKVENPPATLAAFFDEGRYVEYLEAVLAMAALAAPARGDVGVNRLVKSRREGWVALANYVERIDNAGLGSLSLSELRDVTRLYRQAAGDLAYAKTFFGKTHLTRFLNALMARAHNHIYRAPVVERTSLWEFFRDGLPLAFQRDSRYFLLALYLFVAAAVFGAVACAVDERIASVFLGGEAAEGVREHKLWTQSIFAVMPASLMSAAILTNNITVTIAAFALGVTAGLGTGYIILLNGAMLGVSTMFTSVYGMGYDLWSFIGAHGFIELFITIVAGGAGLKMGAAMLAPGDLTRMDALKTAAREGVVLILGGAPVLIVAGFLEGFVSPAQAIPGWIKIAFGLTLLAALLLYLLRPVEPRGDRA